MLAAKAFMILIGMVSLVFGYVFIRIGRCVLVNKLAHPIAGGYLLTVGFIMLPMGIICIVMNVIG